MILDISMLSVPTELNVWMISQCCLEIARVREKETWWSIMGKTLSFNFLLKKMNCHRNSHPGEK